MNFIVLELFQPRPAFGRERVAASLRCLVVSMLQIIRLPNEPVRALVHLFPEWVVTIYEQFLDAGSHLKESKSLLRFPLGSPRLQKVVRGREQRPLCLRSFRPRNINQS